MAILIELGLGQLGVTLHLILARSELCCDVQARIRAQMTRAREGRLTTCLIPPIDHLIHRFRPCASWAASPLRVQAERLSSVLTNGHLTSYATMVRFTDYQTYPPKGALLRSSFCSQAPIRLMQLFLYTRPEHPTKAHCEWGQLARFPLVRIQGGHAQTVQPGLAMPMQR